MKEIPVVITQKDRLYINDILNMSKVYLKKSNMYKDNCQDEDLKNEVGSFVDVLFQAYDQLLFVLEEKK